MIFPSPTSENLLIGCEISKDAEPCFVFVWTEEPLNRDLKEYIGKISETEEIPHIVIVYTDKSEEKDIDNYITAERHGEKVKKYFTEVSKHIGELRDAIAQDVLPSKTQCEELIGDLDNMQRLISERNFIMQHSIEELYGDFSGCSDKIKSCLNNMSDMISAGKVPDTEVVDEFVNSVAELREKYSYVYQSALLQLPSFEMPEDGAGAGEYAYAVKNSKTLILRKKVKEAAECLNMFLSVRSDIPVYSDAIAPFQKEAGEIFEHLSEYGIEDFERIEDKLKGQKALVDAVLCQDKDSDEGLALCDAVTQYYSSRIYSGVVAGKYYLEAAESEPKSGENSDETPAVTVSTDTNEKDNTGLIYQLHENDCFFSTDSDIGEPKEYISPNEDKKTCPSSFCTDVRKGSLVRKKL